MSASATASRPQSVPGRFLTLSLGPELYALNALRVREIIRPVPASPVPRSPKHILGVINLRGKIVPIIDLRIKFDLPRTDRTDRVCVVVVETGAELKQVGLMVDEVQEVVTLNSEEIQDAPSFGNAVDISYVSGLARSKESLMILLDVDRLVAEPQFA